MLLKKTEAMAGDHTSPTLGVKPLHTDGRLPPRLHGHGRCFKGIPASIDDPTGPFAPNPQPTKRNVTFCSPRQNVAHGAFGR